MGCDVCKDESGGAYVGVAAVPGAPVSLGWCRLCLENHAVPLFVAETWLFLEFDDEYMRANGQEPVPLPGVDEFVDQVGAHMAEWALEQSVWLGGGYKSIREALPELWKREKGRKMAEDDDKTQISERATIARDADVPEEIEERLKKEGASDPSLELEE